MKEIDGNFYFKLQPRRESYELQLKTITWKKVDKTGKSIWEYDNRRNDFRHDDEHLQFAGGPLKLEKIFTGGRIR